MMINSTDEDRCFQTAVQIKDHDKDRIYGNLTSTTT